MKIPVRYPALFLAACLFVTTGKAGSIRTVEEYDQSMIDFGISWKKKSPYYPSFYTGFAPRVEEPNRIHFRLARGNQARLTAPLDQFAILTYLYNLKSRADGYKALLSAGLVKPVSHGNAEVFSSILESDAYNILPTMAAFEAGQLSEEQFYSTSLEILKQLNPGRTFAIKIDLRDAILTWRAGALGVLKTASGATDAGTAAKYIGKNPKDSIVAVNNLLYGRINATYLNSSQTEALAALVVSTAGDDAFVVAAAQFLNDVTAGRYDFRVVENGQYRQALVCPGATCELSYTEFTAIYPVGSVLDTISDRDGNRIPRIRENGVMKFVERGYHDVDHIRTEPYYGFMPKMDYTSEGNGIHNPAVRTYLKRSGFKGLYKMFHIPDSDDTLWIVSRGPVSHGCTRMAAGHLQEVRSIFPANPETMTKVLYTGTASTDYDLFDIDADGKLEVMGVNYLVAYQLESSDGDGYREAKGLIEETLNRIPFYTQLYGKNNQFTVSGEQVVFTNPYVSYFSGSPKEQRAKAFSVQFTGDFPLYEQAYQKDKLQFFDIPTLGISDLSADGNNNSNEAAQLVRLLGRATGCGPFASAYKACYENGFRQELKSLVNKLK